MGFEIPIILGLLVNGGIIAAIAIVAAAAIALAIFGIFKAVEYYKDSKKSEENNKKPTVVKTQEKERNKSINPIKQPSLNIAALPASDSQSQINNTQTRTPNHQAKQLPPQTPSQTNNQTPSHQYKG